jgi:hydrogenase expression/formation protein HypC
MYHAVPGRIVAVSGADPATRLGRVDFGGVEREVSLALVPEARVGSYVLVDLGLALSLVDAAEARKVFENLEEIEALSEELLV